MSYNARMKNRYCMFNILFFVALTIRIIFEVIKICIWGSGRPLERLDYFEIVGAGEQLLFFVLWFAFANKYEKNGSFRKTTIVFFTFCSVVSLGNIYTKTQAFSRLFFPTEYYTPVPFDQFSTLFELCYVSIFALVFIAYFIILICKKHFKKSS